METGPRFKVSSERLEERGIEPATPGLQSEKVINDVVKASAKVSRT